jgi:eukaryotic-like serine/threonine-protein kinase
VSSLPERPWSEGRVVGERYQLIRPIGSGGAAVVWLAHDRVEDRSVAVKEFRAFSGPDDETTRHRIRREAHAADRLYGHPHVVAVHDLLWQDGHPWIVMEYVAGESLQDLIGREGRISPGLAARIGVQVLDALHSAHQVGVLHRDVKPSNVLLGEDGAAKLTDFGIARIHGDLSLTVTGEVVGSPGYIAPERVQGFDATPAADLWSLGVMLYAAVEGRMPFQRPTAIATLSAMMGEPVPPPRNAGPLAPVLTGLLTKDPAERMSADRAMTLLDGVLATAPAEDPGRPDIPGLRIERALGPTAWLARDDDGRAFTVRPLPAELVPTVRSLLERPPEGLVGLRMITESVDGPGHSVTYRTDRGSLAERVGGDLADDVRLLAEVARRLDLLNRAGVHYRSLDLDQILFQSTGDGDDTVLLPLPDAPGTESGGDVPALIELARHVLGYSSDARVRELLARPWPDAGAFAQALEDTLASGRFDRSDDVFALDPAPASDDGRFAPSENGTGGLLDPPTTATARVIRPGPAKLRPRPTAYRPGHDRTRREETWRPPEESYSLYVPLRAAFRYVHEPLRLDDDAIPLLGNEHLIRALKERLVNSFGGAFLVTGFRGVGKSTLIEQALADIEKDHPRGRRVLPVVLSVARPLETERLLFAIVRRVFEALTEAGVLDSLPPETRRSLVLAYMRTSLSFKETRADATERSSSVDVDPARLTRGLLGPAGTAIPRAGMSTKRSRSLATEAAFLAYSETDVEHDMMRIVRLLSAVPDRPGRRWWRRRRTPLDLQLVVVLDEVDKLTSLREGLEKVERLLGGIKNLVTMRGAHYLVVAGPDLHDRVVRDSGRGNGIYESVFAWRMYVPCSWSAPARLLADLGLSEPGGGGVIEEFESYLRFTSRGVLRRLLQEVNSFVVWEESRRPYLRITSRHHDAISFYATLERSLDAFFVATDRQVPPTPLGRDRWRLAAYYVMDWVLRGEGRPFTSADVIQAVEDEDFDPLLHVSRAGVESLLEHLAAQGVLELVREPARATATMIPDVAEAQHASYKLEDSLLGRLYAILAQTEHEGSEPGAEPPGRTAPIETLSGGRYEVWSLIGEGGTSSVYEGRDTLLRRPVAVKVLRTALRDDPKARGRFLREALIAGAVHHPNVVDVYEVVSAPDGDGPPAIVMELVAGPTLNQVLERGGALPPARVARLGITLADALGYLAGKGLARIDLKPHNVVLSPARGPVVIDLGIAKIVENAPAWPAGVGDPAELADAATQSGIVIGTPAYLSPEQARGDTVDIRSDIYALGLVLCVCLTGRHPYRESDPVAMMARAVLGGVDTSALPGSPRLREVLARATAPDREDRYARPAGLAAALRATPEAGATAP